MQNNKFTSIMQILDANKNPQVFIKQRLMNTPGFQEKLTQLKNMQQTSGLSEEEFVMQIYKQNGISPDQVKQLQQKLGF